MKSQNQDGESDSRESYGIKVSELLKALAEITDPRNISTTLSTLNNTGRVTSNTRGTFRSRATLPAHISQLSKSHFKRQDHLRESSVPVPAPIITAVNSSQEGQLQPSSPSSNPALLALLVAKSKMLPSDSASSIGQQLKEHKMHPHILDVQAQTKQQCCGPQWTLPGHFPQTGPTTEWFFQDLTDLQRKLYFGASKKSGVQRNSRTAGKTTRHE